VCHSGCVFDLLVHNFNVLTVIVLLGQILFPDSQFGAAFVRIDAIHSRLSTVNNHILAKHNYAGFVALMQNEFEANE
jgi:hypothetical protein